MLLVLSDYPVKSLVDSGNLYKKYKRDESSARLVPRPFIAKKNKRCYAKIVLRNSVCQPVCSPMRINGDDCWEQR